MRLKGKNHRDVRDAVVPKRAPLQARNDARGDHSLACDPLQAICEDRREPVYDVDTKGRDGATFGNDGHARVDTKGLHAQTFGNDSIGFIRVRKRKLKGGHRDWRAYRAHQGILATTSRSFDLVRAVRVDGKPRHEFILGLGSQKDFDRKSADGWFWARALSGMAQYGLDEHQRTHLINELVRKGARVPTPAECEEHARDWPRTQAKMAELGRWWARRVAP
jgi:hypothetical protein